MAATQYQIFCKYLNEDINKIVNNSSTKEWISAETWYSCKVAYNVTDKTASNAMVTAIESDNTGLPKGTCYRTVYDEIVAKMNSISETTDRLRYDDLSTEEKKIYDLCSKYKKIEKMVANDECVVEYAMIRPCDELKTVGEVTISTSSNGSGTTEKRDFHHGGVTTYSQSGYANASVKKYAATTSNVLKAKAKLLDNELSEIIYSQINSSTNEKYNMLFTFNGMIQTDEQLDGWISNGTINTLPSFYKFFSDDLVCEYAAIGQSDHTKTAEIETVDGVQRIKNPAGGNGTEYKIGSVPIKSLNAQADTLTSTAGSIRDITFSGVSKEICVAVYEGMERLQVQPWFLIATCNSLKAAMTKVEQLIDIYGKDAVKLGKVVPLEQYIEIV